MTDIEQRYQEGLALIAGSQGNYQDKLLAKQGLDAQYKAAQAAFKPAAQVPQGGIITGGSVPLPQGGTATYSIPDSKPVSVEDYAKRGDLLASQFSIPELIPDKVVSVDRPPSQADLKANPNAAALAVDRITRGGIRNRKGTLADIENAQIIPMGTVDPKTLIPYPRDADPDQLGGLVDAYGVDPYGALSFGDNLPVIPLDRQKFEDYQRIRNAGRGMRGDQQISDEAIRTANDFPALPSDAFLNTEFMSESPIPAIPDQTQRHPLLQPAPAANRNSPLIVPPQAIAPAVTPVPAATPVATETVALKPLTSDVVFTARQNVGNNRDKIRAWLLERGYEVD